MRAMTCIPPDSVATQRPKRIFEGKDHDTNRLKKPVAGTDDFLTKSEENEKNQAILIAKKKMKKAWNPMGTGALAQFRQICQRAHFNLTL